MRIAFYEIREDWEREELAERLQCVRLAATRSTGYDHIDAVGGERSA